MRKQAIQIFLGSLCLVTAAIVAIVWVLRGDARRSLSGEARHTRADAVPRVTTDTAPPKEALDGIVEVLRSQIARGSERIGELERAVSELEEELRRCTDDRSTENLALLFQDERTKRLLQLSSRDHLAGGELEHPELVRRLSESYDKLQPGSTLSYSAEKHWLFIGVSRESLRGAFVEWVEGVVGETLSYDERTSVASIFDGYCTEVVAWQRKLSTYRDWRLRDLAFQRLYQLRNEEVVAALGDTKATVLSLFWKLKTRLDHPWIDEFLREAAIAEDDPSELEIVVVEWLVSAVGG